MLFDGRLCYSIDDGGEHELKGGELLMIPAYYNIKKIALTTLDIGFLNVNPGQDVKRLPLGDPVMKLNARMIDDAELLKTIDPEINYRRIIMSDMWYQICLSYSAPKISEPPKNDIPLRPLLDHIDASFHNKLTLDDLCRLSGYSKSALIREFRVFTGQTPMEYVNELRIKTVKRLMANERLTLRELAARCGFSNEYYLSNVFKAKTGMTPSEFRQKMT